MIMPLYLLNKEMGYREIDYMPLKFPERRSKRSRMMQSIRSMYGLTEDEIYAKSHSIYFLKKNLRDSLPNKYVLYSVDPMKDIFRVAIECSEDEFMVFNLSDSFWLEEGFAQTTREEIRHHYGLVK